MPQFNQDALKSVRNKKRRQNSRDPRQRNRNRDNMPDNSGGNGGGNSDGGVGGDRVTPPLQDQPTVRPNSAFGQGFDPDMYGDLKANPDILASQWMDQQGIDPMASGGMAKVWGDLSAVMPQLFYLTQGLGANGAGAGDTSFLDYAGDFMNQYTSTGGGAVGSNVLQNLFNGPDQNSVLGQMINDPSQDPATQARTVLGLIGSGLATNMSGASGSAIMGRAQQLATEWMREQATNGANTITFPDFLKQNGFSEQFNY